MTSNTLLDFTEAKALIFEQAKAINHRQSELINLDKALNRIVAKPILSPMNVPSFNNSAMDGYAIRLEDLNKSSTLPVGGTVLAGQADLLWKQNSCLRIMTGAPVPDDADAVVMQEHVEINGDHIAFNVADIKKGQNIRYKGESVKKDDIVCNVGEKLTIPKLSTLATLGLTKINVFKPLKVALFSTGDELVSIGEQFTHSNQIFDSNRFTLSLMLKSLGCDVVDLGILKDDLSTIANTLKAVSNDVDIIITSGGVSVGDADYTKKAVSSIGEVNFWKIAMKPGKPFAFGKINKALFCGLPGNPVSSFVTFYQLVRPLIFKLNGNGEATKVKYISMRCTSNLKKSKGRIDFQRGYVYPNDINELVVKSSGAQGSHITSASDHANCFIVLEKDRGNVMAGEWVNVEFFDSTLL
ncbi:molybdopterin-binding protein [Orbaceae bacterium ac157xtp]